MTDAAAARRQARLATASIDGWLSEAQGQALFEYASRCTGRGAIVEIGSWKGRSTVWLAYGARMAGQRVIAIDPHVNSREDPEAQTFAEFSRNLRLARVDDVVTPVVMSSEAAAAVVPGGVELLFVDGDHSDDGAERDASAWLDRIIDGGVLLMHDVVTASYTGPRRVFRRRVCWNGRFDSIGRIGSMGVARKVSQRSAWAATWGALAGLLLYIVDAKRTLKRILKP